MNRKIEKSLGIILTVVIILAALTLMQGIGKRERAAVGGDQRQSAPKTEAQKSIRSYSGDWAKLELILDNVVKNYVDSIDNAKVIEDILPSIMAELDPHSIYLPPEDLKSADESLQGEFYGIGIQFTVPEDTAVVSNVVIGGPAEKVGIISGDRIISVNDTAIAGVKMSQDDMVKRMRGKKNSEVRIGVMRDGETVYFDIVRKKISDKSVDTAFMINDTTGFIKLTKFNRTTYSEFKKALESLESQGMKRLIFDLRDNGGGYMDQALLLCNEFLPKGTLMVYMEGAHRKREDVYADGRGKYQSLPLAVLIDENSASSSEIFAGAMQDNDRATIYGLRSFGKGLVQEPMYFSDGSGIRLTVARYHTPTGRCIQKPYTDNYMYDIYDRYAHGEMMSADSIRVNDSLKFTTPGGRTVYGGGGIIPDVFVPLDTTGVTDFLVKCNRQSVQFKFTAYMRDAHPELRKVQTMDQYNKFLETIDLKSEFLKYARKYDIRPAEGEWEISGETILIQVRAMIARFSPLDDAGFYMIYKEIDNTIKAALEE